MAAQAGQLVGRHIVMGVTGSIAAYKAVEVVSRLRKLGAEVHVIMTRAAREFVTETTFREISGQHVAGDMWAPVHAFQVEHIALAKLADLVLVAPATAHVLAKAAHGLADDMLSTTLLATRAPVFFAPAMNTNMYENVATQENLQTLRKRGCHIVEPDSGHLACGTSGKGRLPEPAAIVAEVVRYFTQSQALAGRKVLVTAAGTREPIDPVRFLGNRSTGRMGFAVAAEAARRGAEVTLIAGPTSLRTPAGVRRIDVETAQEMRAAVLADYDAADIVIKTAAVADYRPATVAEHKIKKSEGELTLTLVRNPDILYELGQKKTRQVLVGFAAETRDVAAYARAKLAKKNLDFIVANNVAESDAGFGAETNRVTIYGADGSEESYPLLSKAEVAAHILDKAQSRLSR
ncbi:MAG: bifunctional phosphopantothenoylcysteine decarboxylase/phosphopantothenate--cysteine ligase CoaBC [Selenomonadaceae bacterium]|nr:bifunctional phosphopantothenoylcysteine decarboxylase/phosphopantothenate--cysteine ligase CoaBC [Selenomonadaceae bacterium]